MPLPVFTTITRLPFGTWFLWANSQARPAKADGSARKRNCNAIRLASNSQRSWTGTTFEKGPRIPAFFICSITWLRCCETSSLTVSGEKGADNLSAMLPVCAVIPIKLTGFSKTPVSSNRGSRYFKRCNWSK